MQAVVSLLIGIIAGFSAMTIISFYKWFLKTWNN